MPNTEKLVAAAMLLRAAAPGSWDQFVAAMREYSAGTTAEMVRCPPELLMRAQGMAIAASDIAMTLATAPKLHEKMQNANIGRTNNGRREQYPANR